MKILEYDKIDPLKAVYITQLAHGFALTRELAAHIRQTDPRSFPCLAVYAVDDDTIMGQAGIFRLPMISIAGREDVGAIWTLSAHPHYAESSVGSRLLDEAHARMRQAGLRFSALGMDRQRATYQLFQQHGYVETNVWATALAAWETAHQPTRLRAEPAGSDGYDLIEQIFMEIAVDYLGFAWRHTPFVPLRQVEPAEIWILRENSRVAGYALARHDQTMLTIANMLLRPRIDAAEAVAAVAAALKSAYVQVQISRPIEITSLKNAGYHLAHPSWSGFMIKPLVPEMTYEDVRRLFGIGTDQFLISWLDLP